MRRFGEILRDARTHRGLTQKELAKNVPTDHTYISKLEKGVCLPPRKLALGIADALGINDAEDRITFLSTAGVLSDEDLKDFQLVRVGSHAGGQALTQGPPAQQLPAVAGITEAVFQQMLTLLQALTTALPLFTTAVGQLMTAGAQLQAQVAALQQPKIGTPFDIPQRALQEEVAHSSVAQSLDKSQALTVPSKERMRGAKPKIRSALSIGELVGRQIMDWRKKEREHHSLQHAQEWEEEWTRVIEQEGDLYVVMKGIQGMTLPQGYYDEQVKPLLEAEGEEAEKIAKFIRHAFACRERRRIAFEAQVKKYKFRHIMPIGALETYKTTGFHRPDEWTRIFNGNPVPWPAQAEHIRYIISLLENEKDYKNFELGLLTGEAGESDLYNHVIWEIKGDHTVVLEDLTFGERDFIIKDPEVVRDYCTCFDWLWESEEVIKDKLKVIELLGAHIKSLVNPSVTS